MLESGDIFDLCILVSSFLIPSSDEIVILSV